MRDDRIPIHNSTLTRSASKLRDFEQRARAASSLGKPKTDEGTTTPGLARQKRSTLRPRPISPASPAQQAKVRDLACIHTGYDRHDGRGPIDAAHLTPRSAGGCDDPLCVVPLWRYAHRDFDDGKIDLLPNLRPFGAERQWLPEILHALDHYDGDLISLLQRLTGERWRPESWTDVRAVPTAGTPIGGEG